MGETDVGKRKGPHALPFSLHKDESFKPGQNNLATQESPCRHLHYNKFIIFFLFVSSVPGKDLMGEKSPGMH